MHRAATEAFHRYRYTAVVAPRLYYVARPPEVAAQFALHLHPSEMTVSVCIDIAEVKPMKLQGLRTYRLCMPQPTPLQYTLKTAQHFDAHPTWRSVMTQLLEERKVFALAPLYGLRILV